MASAPKLARVNEADSGFEQLYRISEVVRKCFTCRARACITCSAVNASSTLAEKAGAGNSSQRRYSVRFLIERRKLFAKTKC